MLSFRGGIDKCSGANVQKITNTTIMIYGYLSLLGDKNWRLYRG